MSGRQSLTSVAINGLTTTAASKVIEAVAQIVVLAILARLLTPEDFGILSAVLVVAGLASMSYQVGVGPALVQRAEIRDDHLSSAFWFSTILAFVVTAVCYYSSPFLAQILNIADLTPYLRVASLVFLLEGASVVSISLLSRQYKFKTLAIANAASYVIGFGVVGITAAFAGLGTWSLIAAYLGRAAINSTIVIAGAPSIKVRHGTIQALKELLWYGGGFTIGRLFNYAATQGDNFVAARLLGASSLGVYSRAYQLIVMPASLFGRVIDRVLFPIMSGVQNDSDRISRAYLRCYAAATTLSIPVSIILVVYAHDIIQIILGPGWEEAVLPLQILATGLMFRTGYKITDVVIRSIGAIYQRAAVQSMYALLTVGLGYGGASVWGLPGLAIGTVVAIVINHLALQVLLKLRTRISVKKILISHAPGVLLGFLTMLTIGGLWSVDGYANWSPLIRLIAAITLSGSLCVFTVSALSRELQFESREEWWAIAQALRVTCKRVGIRRS